MQHSGSVSHARNGEPVDIEERLADPETYEDTILRIFAKRSERGQGSARRRRRHLFRRCDRTAGPGQGHRPQCRQRRLTRSRWTSGPRSRGQGSRGPQADFTDHVVGSALFKLLSHNARCYGLTGVYSYLPGVTNLGAMQAFAGFVRAHRKRSGVKGPPLYVLQSDFEHYGDDLPVGPDAALWRIVREVTALGSANGEIGPNAWDLITSLVRPVVREKTARSSPGCAASPWEPLSSRCSAILQSYRWTRRSRRSTASSTPDTTTTSSLPIRTSPHSMRQTPDRFTGRGVGRQAQASKELRTALSGNGKPSAEDAAYRGRDRIDCLGLTVSHAGTVSLGPHRLRRFVGRVARRIDAAAPALSPLPANERARHLVAATNVMLDVANPFAVAGLSAVLDATTDRGVAQGSGLPDSAQDRAGCHQDAGRPRLPAAAARGPAPATWAGFTRAAAELAMTRAAHIQFAQARIPP